MAFSGVVPIAHTPLGKGLASGVYTASNPTGGKMGAPKYVFKDLFPLTPIHTALVAVSASETANGTRVTRLQPALFVPTRSVVFFAAADAMGRKLAKNAPTLM